MKEQIATLAAPILAALIARLPASVDLVDTTLLGFIVPSGTGQLVVDQAVVLALALRESVWSCDCCGEIRSDGSGGLTCEECRKRIIAAHENKVPAETATPSGAVKVRRKDGAYYLAVDGKAIDPAKTFPTHAKAKIAAAQLLRRPL